MEFQFQHHPSNEYSGLISFKIDWFNLLAILGSLKSLLQDHSSKASILQCSAFFIVQLSHPYMTTGKTIALTIQNFVGKIMSLVFNMLSRFVIAFLPRRKHLFEFRKGRGTRARGINVMCDEIADSPQSLIADDPSALLSPTSSPFSSQ